MSRLKADENPIVLKTFSFAVNAAKYCQVLQKSKDFPLANQLFKSSTSIGANVREAQNAESKADFIHKFKIAIKEVDETEYWLALCKELHNHSELPALNEQLIEIQKIINKIISTSKKA
ncbi:four helix bundle protein [Daejeonella rubra]|uniref:Four helix bundle protein n=1 Tax=Daejeonella rubra TaxID=990371 RepID=A0A1G9XA70_9SPHI|nr:four helix bundle protein [Daejeonella rubra]SDM93421.1 four helix bundle protein [Daejeonella rubra]